MSFTMKPGNTIRGCSKRLYTLVTTVKISKHKLLNNNGDQDTGEVRTAECSKKLSQPRTIHAVKNRVNSKPLKGANNNKMENKMLKNKN